MLPSGNAAPVPAPSHTWHVPLCVFADALLSHFYLFASTAWAESESRDFGSFSSALQLFYLIPEPSSQGAGMVQPRDLEWNWGKKRNSEPQEVNSPCPCLEFAPQKSQGVIPEGLQL